MTQQVGIYGGVGFGTNTYHSDHSAADRLGRTARQSRPSVADLSWEVGQGGDNLNAVALQLAPAPIRGGYRTTRTDAHETISPTLTAEVTLRYHSLDPRPSAYGKGWSLDVPSVSVRNVSIPGSNKYRTQAIVRNGDNRMVFSRTTEGILQPDSPSSRYSLLGVTAGDGKKAMFAPIVLPEVHLQPGLSGHAIRIKNEEGQSVGFTGFVVIDRDSTRTAFDPSGRLSAIQTPDGGTLHYQYTPTGLLTSITDRTGSRVRLTYNESGQLSQLSVSGKESFKYEYDDAGHLLHVSNATGRTVAAYRYDESGLMIQAFAGSDQPVASLTYDAIGRVTMHRDQSGNAWQFVYDDQNNEIRSTGPSGAKAAWQYDDEHRLISETDFSGRVRRWQYDSAGRVVKVTNGNGHSTTFHYDTAGNLSEILAPMDHHTRMLNYGPHGRPGIVIDPGLRVALYEYDSRGNITSVSAGYRLRRGSGDGISYTPEDPITQTYEYDQIGNLSAIRYIDGSAAKYVYDGRGNLESVIPSR